MNIWELQEGKFYRIKNDIYSTVYKVKNGHYLYYFDNGWVLSKSSYEHVISLKFEEMKGEDNEI